MIPIKTILFAVFGLNLFVVLILGVNLYRHRPGSQKVVNLPAVFGPDDITNKVSSSFLEETPLYRFINPKTAYSILEQLDIYGTVAREAKSNFNSLAGGFKINNEYCKQHRALFVEHPELVFEGMNFITNYWRTHKVRTDVIPALGGQDLHPEIYIDKKGVKTFNSTMRLDANIFFTSNLFYQKRELGKQFSCLSQASNHIPGHDTMYRKDNVGKNLVEYAKKYTTRPECFNFKKYFPKTWVLQKRDQCLDFFREFTSKEYQQLKKERNVVYFRKIGAFVHEGKGVFPVDNSQEMYLRKLYNNGKRCGLVKDNNLIQYNIHNPLLLQNRKFGFRMFLFVASSNPMLAYYHDGYARLSLNEYDAGSREIKTFVTNIGVNIKEASQGTEWEKLTPQQIQEKTCWFLEDFQDYIVKNNITKDPNYLDNTLRPELKQVMVHLVRMTQSGFAPKSSVFEIFGLDFVMDADMNLWFIEANAMPLMDGFTDASTKLLNRMMSGAFEIVLGLLKSRMKRAIAYVNMLTKEVDDSGLPLTNLNQKRLHFKEITKNYFEPEFEPSPNNTFHKIVDDREYGVKRYSGIISADCL